ncbi:MAG: heme NO-binding domain-containing protein [Candidatus Eremiobacteraeota bacterium]|nr:heme NO-binding domain-containing protein [Candidatus Eremiobacteraeota bacterium]
MANKAIEDLITRDHGEAMWEQVRKKAGLEVEAFISTESYPDEMTYNLVGAASAELSMPPGDVLRAFGRHWVLRTAAESYRDLMESTGRSLGEFLDNLPDLHARVSLLFPDLKPPRFIVSDRREQSLHLHYFSGRRGLAPFVEGLLQGLAERFGTEIELRALALKDGGADHDEFRITWKTAGERL